MKIPCRRDQVIADGTVVEIRSGTWRGARARVDWHSFDEAGFGDLYYSLTLETGSPGTRIALWPQHLRPVAP